MTRIRATCPTCGEIDLRPRDIRLELVRDASGDVAEGSTYRFGCPSCHAEVVKPADERIARLLVTGGVELLADPSGDELDRLLEERPPHPEVRPDGPPLTADDLLDLHLLLDRDDWFSQLEAMV